MTIADTRPDSGDTIRVASGIARARGLATEAMGFLGVGGVAYVVDVVAFNVLLSIKPFAQWHPTAARCVAVAFAMVVTYVGNHFITWRGRGGKDRRREVALFVVVNLVGLGFSLGCLTISHDMLGLTSRLADNVSANVVGLALGTLFRFWGYRRFVFVAPTPSRQG